MLLPLLTVDQLRERVREAEALLRVARQHARDAHDDPANSAHASARIQSICREVEALFPGLNEPSRPDPELAETMAALRAETPESAATDADEEDANAEGDAAGDEADDEADDEAGDDDGEADADDEDADELDIDYAKLAAAIENETLMAAFPEPGRTAFKRAARYLVEANERHVLFGRVIAGFESVSELAHQGVEDLRRKLALAMTLEGLANKGKS
jgi:hypothetical protein